MIARVPLYQLAVWLSSTEVGHHGEIAEAHRPVVARGDDDVAELLAVGQFGLRLDRQRLLWVSQRADRRVGIGGRDRRLHLVDANAARRQRIRVELNADCVFLAAEDLRPAPRHRWSKAPAKSPAARRRPSPGSGAISLRSVRIRIGASAGLTLR